ncbi:WhiB family transcriptional regulator [Streptomyces huiliensis]|uniref:WhiB family transcriptional regulator n=1 Tax=Streptomyces huiliensis TaxID=2876027 RepID=UPI001CBDFBF9|nr:WhiB family transcriptional regulator [Streptomyces huiliensis]MBZ4322475.1 WhiB family transcriptional regulator [Streptomyces huiliensis]
MRALLKGTRPGAVVHLPAGDAVVGFELAPDPGLGDALCKTVAPEVFFPEPGETAVAEVARELCERCPVRAACLEDALAAEGNARPYNRYGIRGGKDEQERYLIYRARRRAAEGEKVTNKCGSEPGYHRHRRDGELPCPACRDAYRTRRRGRRARARARKAVAA